MQELINSIRRKRDADKYLYVLFAFFCPTKYTILGDIMYSSLDFGTTVHSVDALIWAPIVPTIDSFEVFRDALDP